MNILCICEDNISRSPMLKKVVELALGDKHRVESCGVHERAKNHSKASLGSLVAVARNLPGHNLEGHRSEHVSHVDLDQFDHIICTGQAEADAVVELGAPAKKIHVMEISNPSDQDLQAYEKCFEDIVNKVQKWVS